VIDSVQPIDTFLNCKNRYWFSAYNKWGPSLFGTSSQ
jgi:hypothetical protein